jgi:hypothetical protein
MCSVQEAVAIWAETLTGLSRDRVLAATSSLGDWGIAHLSEELLKPDVDSVVAATLLVEAVTELVARGAEPDLTLKKLRDDRQVWGAWAELRAAHIFLLADPQTRIALEPEQRKGKPGPDFRFELPDGSTQLVEFKAVGLSQREANFCQRLFPTLRRLMPKAGLATFHGPLDVEDIRITREQRRLMQGEAAALTRTVLRYPRGLRGITAVAQHSEAEYIRRLQRKLGQAFAQLPEGDECWVAFHWTNGATQQALAAAIDWSAVPDRVVGLAFVGSVVVFPHREIHVFHLSLPREVEPDGDPWVESTLDEDFARLVLGRVEASAAVRATLLRVGGLDLVRRDGLRPILPFNLIMDADPTGIGSRPDRFAQKRLRPAVPGSNRLDARPVESPTNVAI